MVLPSYLTLKILLIPFDVALVSLCPVSFALNGKELLGRVQHFVNKHWISIPSIYSDLIMDMRTASYLDNVNLDKKVVGNRTYDSLDSLRLALKMFEVS
jgi:hypothetical protein